jgi:lipoprotein-anchoring transpeptidase ErfK/SrfK
MRPSMRNVKSPSMKRSFLLLSAALATTLLAAPAAANDRYAEPPPLVVSPDLSAPWVLQLRRGPATVPTRVIRRAAPGAARQAAPEPAVRPSRRQQVVYTIRPTRQAQPRQAPSAVQNAAVPAVSARDAMQMDPKFLPQTVSYDGPQAPGTIVVDTAQKFLYLVEPDGKARRYGVGVGKEGFLWKGTENIVNKREWPEWRPPAEMIAREKKKGRVLPAMMEGGPANPLGARALYLGDTLYRIHGTNAPWTIGHNVSSGCIRMRNEDVMDLYERVDVGAKVVVI